MRYSIARKDPCQRRSASRPMPAWDRATTARERRGTRVQSTNRQSGTESARRMPYWRSALGRACRKGAPSWSATILASSTDIASHRTIPARAVRLASLTGKFRYRASDSSALLLQLGKEDLLHPAIVRLHGENRQVVFARLGVLFLLEQGTRQPDPGVQPTPVGPRGCRGCGGEERDRSTQLGLGFRDPSAKHLGREEEADPSLKRDAGVVGC